MTIRLRPDLDTPASRMVAALHHVRCEECDACQEYIDPPSAPLCDHARSAVRLSNGEELGHRARAGLERVGWIEHYAYPSLTDSAKRALEWAAKAAELHEKEARAARV